MNHNAAEEIQRQSHRKQYSLPVPHSRSFFIHIPQKIHQAQGYQFHRIAHAELLTAQGAMHAQRNAVGGAA